jgi:hypothetical protein
MGIQIEERTGLDTPENLEAIRKDIDKGIAEGYITYTDAKGSIKYACKVLGDNPARLLPDAMQLFAPIAQTVGKKFQVNQQKDAKGYDVISFQWI